MIVFALNDFLEPVERVEEYEDRLFARDLCRYKVTLVYAICGSSQHHSILTKRDERTAHGVVYPIVLLDNLLAQVLSVILSENMLSAPARLRWEWNGDAPAIVIRLHLEVDILDVLRVLDRASSASGNGSALGDGQPCAPI